MYCFGLLLREERPYRFQKERRLVCTFMCFGYTDPAGYMKLGDELKGGVQFEKDHVSLLVVAFCHGWACVSNAVS